MDSGDGCTYLWLYLKPLNHFKWVNCIVCELYLNKALKKTQWDFPHGSGVKNPSASAGYTGSIPDLGRSHMPQGNWALCHNYWSHVLQLLKPMYLEPMLCSERNDHSEKAAMQNERVVSARCNSRKAVHSNEDPTQPKKKKKSTN